jgi:hypothetical protein
METIAVINIVIPGDIVIRAFMQKEVEASNLYLAHTRLEYKSE